MSNDDIEIKILEEEVAPIVPESQPKPTVQERASDVAQQARDQAADVAHKVWQSDTRKRVTGTVGRGAKKVVKKGGQAMTNAMVKTAERQARQQAAVMQQRLQETDWKEVAKGGTASGLRWLSKQVAKLATRFAPPETATDEPQSDK